MECATIRTLLSTGLSGIPLLLILAYVLGAQQKRLIEKVLLITNNVCFVCVRRKLLSQLLWYTLYCTVHCTCNNAVVWLSVLCISSYIVKIGVLDQNVRSRILSPSGMVVKRLGLELSAPLAWF